MKDRVFSDKDFKKSSFSALQYPACVSVAKDKDGNVAIRDTKDPSKNTLYFNKNEF